VVEGGWRVISGGFRVVLGWFQVGFRVVLGGFRENGSWTESVQASASASVKHPRVDPTFTQTNICSASFPEHMEHMQSANSKGMVNKRLVGRRGWLVDEDGR
jgi:hypothetical protein